MQQIRWQQRFLAIFFLLKIYYLIRSFIFTPISMLIKVSLGNIIMLQPIQRQWNKMEHKILIYIFSRIAEYSARLQQLCKIWL